jgi:hypothetical protein
MPLPARRRVAYRDGVSRLDGLGSRLAGWASTPVRAGTALGRPGIRPVDVAAVLVVITAVELDSAVAAGPGQRPLNALPYAFGAVVAIPILVRHRWPREALSPLTVKTHVSRAMTKLAARDRVQLVAIAYTSGLAAAGGAGG